MFLRPYRREDKRRLQQLFFETVHAVNARDYAPEQLDAWAPAELDRETWARFDQHHCFVVEDRKILVGFAAMSNEGMLDFLYVHKNTQGKGIGTSLLKQIERLARKKSCEVLLAEVSPGARIFFEKNGFSVHCEVLKYFGEVAIPLFRMGKNLPAPAAQT